MTSATRPRRVLESDAARSARDLHERRARTLQLLDKVWPLAREVKMQLVRTGMPTTWSPGVLPANPVIDGTMVPALQLGGKGVGPYPSGHDFILDDGTLICWRPVRNLSKLAGKSQPETLQSVWYPSDEIMMGHRAGLDMSERPAQLVGGLNYLLEGLKKLPDRASEES